MDFDLPGDDDPRRSAVRAWIEANPDPTGRQLAEAGYVVPNWPRPWGLDADPMHQIIIDQELGAAGISRPDNAIGIGWAAPTIALAGTEEQKQRWLPGIFSGEDFWCQLFSEPDAGSDLASLGTRAVRDGDEYVITGSKIWSSAAHHAQFGILIARTNPDAPKHKGISYFVMPMDSDGLTLSPIVDMTTAHSFNETFFDEVRIPADHLIGAEGDGWRLAKVTLSNERASLSSAGSLWGSGPPADRLIELLAGAGGVTDPALRDRAVRLYINGEVLRLIQLRTLTANLQGRSPGPEASAQKILGDELGQEIMDVAKRVAGTHGLLTGSGPPGVVPRSEWGTPTEMNFPRGSDSQYPDVDPIWHYGFLFSPALTLGGGTFAIQRNIVAEHVLGLPRDIDPSWGQTWSETRRASRSSS